MIASELKVYRDTFTLVSLIVDIQARFPRMHKYTLGQKMTNVALELFEYIQLANMSREGRARHLTGFTVKFELLKTLIRLCSEKDILTLKQQADMARLTNTIGKQVTAWKNASARPS